MCHPATVVRSDTVNPYETFGEASPRNMKWFCILTSTGFAVSAIIRPTIPATTLSPSPQITPSPVFARQITSCALVSAPAFTIDGRTYSASSSCTCNGGVQAGASRTVGPDGKTTWECAAKSTPMPISTEEAAPTTTWLMRVVVGDQKVGDTIQSVTNWQRSS